MDKKKKNINIENRKARHDYFIGDTLECGIALKGNEVKSIRDGQVSIKESWVAIENNELFIKQMHITPWKTANSFDVDENRDRKLLAHKKEIKDLEKAIKIDGYTLVPLKVYINSSGKCKVLISVAKGKHDYDKRESEKQKQIEKDIRRIYKNM